MQQLLSILCHRHQPCSPASCFTDASSPQGVQPRAPLAYMRAHNHTLLVSVACCNSLCQQQCTPCCAQFTLSQCLQRVRGTVKSKGMMHSDIPC
jgi:hypothetical protein